jgi:DNA-binding MarR family transcriptional regulator
MAGPVEDKHAHDPDYPRRVAERYRAAFPRADEAAIDISLQIFSCSAAQSASLARFFSRLGLIRTRGRYTALRNLYFAPDGKLTQNELRAELNVTSPNVSYLIDELEKEELVSRSPHPTDRRVTYVALTDRGRELCDVLVPAMVDFMHRMSGGFSVSEKKQFLDYLRRFETNAGRSYDGVVVG